MKISSIPQIYRNLNRWREILSVLSKYELATWIGRLGPDFAKDLLKEPGGTGIARHTWEARIRLAMGELGPTFIKLGQILSTRPDLVGVDLADELRQLQDNVPADPPETIHKTIEQELGRPVEAVFAEFDDQAMASASIGQVHRAKLLSGDEVAVKVQRADIARKVKVDMDILAGLAQVAERLPEFQNYRPTAVAAEFRRAMHREIDFCRELRNMQHFARDFRDAPHVHIPRTYPEFSTERVLTMELLDGVKLSDLGSLPRGSYDPQAVARLGAEICMEMIFTHGFYHADPHPSNVLLMDGNIIGLLDFGMVGRIDERLHEDIVDMLLAVAGADAEYLTSIITRLGTVPAGLDRASLSLDVTDFVAHYGNMSLQQFDLSGALTEMMEMIRRYQIMLPARIAMLLKALITLEGTARLVSPNFSLLEVMAPYQRKLVWRRFSPRWRFRKLRRLFSEFEHLVEVLPSGIVEILEQVQTGKFDVHLDHRGLEPSVNRLVLGMLASALLLGSSLLLSHKVPPVINLPWLGIVDLSAMGALGMFTSIAMGLRLWRAINKSGRLDRRH